MKNRILVVFIDLFAQVVKFYQFYCLILMSVTNCK